MTFSLSRPSTPVNHPQIAQDVDPQSSTSQQPHRLEPDSMRGEKDPRPALEVHLDSDYFCLKGTGGDVEPARLTGRVALYLAESTPIKEITLQFRGKARLPPSPHDSSKHINGSMSTYIICNHDWSFLEGEKKHSHTLKAGRHFFPFQLEIGGSLPASLYTSAFGGASVAYKLRAQAVRTGFNSNLQAVSPVHILRSFTSEALEYQQTLEIENTWPEKLMYSIMIPHKAWAVTDTITAQVKFSPLVKGVGVVSVGTTIQQTTKVYHGRNVTENVRVAASVQHEIVDGKAVEMPERPRWTMASRTPSAVTSPAATSPSHQPPNAGYFSLSPAPSSSSPCSSPEAGPSSQAAVAEPEPSVPEQGQDDVVAFISLPIPATVVSTHSVEPITVSHRLRWSILIINADGHTSELRCSLPVHLLDRRLLKEARAHTSATRRLLLGGSEVPPEAEEEIELPSYMAHVRDRVANMYLPEAATMRVSNPWMSQCGTPPALPTPGLVSHSGRASPLAPHLLSHLPHAPGSGDSTPLDWLNSELLLSMDTQTGSPPSESQVSSSLRRPHSHISSSSNSDSETVSRVGSAGPSSSWPSRRTSRASSPERHHHHPLSSDAARAQSIPVSGSHETYIHSSNAASRNLHSVFSVSMKPFTAHPHWPGLSSLSSSSRSTSHTSLSSLTSISPAPALVLTSGSPGNEARRHPDPARNRAGTTPIPPSDNSSSSPSSFLQRAYTEVPDYDVAARGFLGGVPPLSSMRGLPSYEEAERAHLHTTPTTPPVH